MPRYRFDQIAINFTEKRKPTESDVATYIGLEHMDSHSLTVKRWGSDVPIIGDKLVMKKGDVLLGKRNAYLRRAAIAPFDGLFSAHGMVLRPKTDVVDKDFFPIFIASDYFFDEAIRISVGSLSPTINWKDLKDVEFNLPTLDEQRKLAKILWAIIKTANSYQEMLEKQDLLIKSQFIEMFGDLGEDPFGFGLATLGECTLLNPRKPKNISDDLKVSFVAMPSVSEKGIIDASTIKNYGEVNKGFTYFEEDDVLFAKITPCMENGKGCVATGLCNRVGFGSTEFHVLRPISGKSNPYWIYAITSMKSFRDIAKKNMTGTGGQLRVPVSFLENFEIACPPIELQLAFERKFKQIDKSKFEIEKSLNEITKLYQKIIKDCLKA